MKIGRVTSKNTRVTNAPFWMRRQKSAYLTEYLNNYWTDLNSPTFQHRCMYGDYITYKTFRGSSSSRCAPEFIVQGVWARVSLKSASPLFLWDMDAQLGPI